MARDWAVKLLLVVVNVAPGARCCACLETTGVEGTGWAFAARAAPDWGVIFDGAFIVFIAISAPRADVAVERVLELVPHSLQSVFDSCPTGIQAKGMTLQTATDFRMPTGRNRTKQGSQVGIFGCGLGCWGGETDGSDVQSTFAAQGWRCGEKEQQQEKGVQQGSSAAAGRGIEPTTFAFGSNRASL